MQLQEQAGTELIDGYVSQDAEWKLTAAQNRSLWCVVVVDLFCSGLLIMVISRWYL